MRPILDVAAELGLPAEFVEPYGAGLAKVRLNALDATRPQGKLVLVTAAHPTKHGEGKTVTTIGLAQALRRIGYRAAATLRQPSLGPVFGIKGGATGGGRSSVEPAARINFHCTGDFHAVADAQNLFAALLDAHLHHGNALGIDAATIEWPRAIDMNDRTLRKITAAGRESGFVITAASEVMAILALATSVEDLRDRLGRILAGWRADRSPVLASDLRASGAMTALLVDALQPNLAQSTEGAPVFVHAGPFANIAHGTASVISQRLALGLADFVVNETGFAADLGAEKYFDIVMRQPGLRPSVAVLVASVRALGAQAEGSLERGVVNLARHAENLRMFGVPVVAAVNRFPGDSDADLAWLRGYCESIGLPCAVNDVFARGGEGGEELARLVAAAEPGTPEPLYPLDLPLAEKVRVIARRVYRAGEVRFEPSVLAEFDCFERAGYGRLPVCMAKTQYSFSDNPKLLGAPEGFPFTVTDARLLAGAGFVTAVAGAMTLMPGLGKDPAAHHISVDAAGRVTGLG